MSDNANYVKWGSNLPQRGDFKLISFFFPSGKARDRAGSRTWMELGLWTWGGIFHDADPAGSRGCSAAVVPFDRGRLIKVISFGLGEP
jgi:hypothetical protein